MPEYLLVAEHEGKPAGVLLLSREISPVLDKNLGMLCFIAVDERFRKMRVGRALVKKHVMFFGGKEKAVWKWMLVWVIFKREFSILN
jgi:predicted N-acetyltransferase YhbS